MVVVLFSNKFQSYIKQTFQHSQPKLFTNGHLNWEKCKTNNAAGFERSAAAKINRNQEVEEQMEGKTSDHRSLSPVNSYDVSIQINR